MDKVEKIDPYDGLTKPWRKFFNRFNEIDQVLPSEWKPLHLLAYTCRRFKDTYGREYSVSIKNAPSKCPDIQIIKRIIAMLGTTNTRIVKDYIDWVYDYKINKPSSKVRIRSITFFLTPELTT